MTFGRWLPLREASVAAPPIPGVVQLRLAQGLIDYPRGKSAMVHYCAAADLRRAIEELASLHGEQDWLCRHSLEMSAREYEDVPAAAQRLLDTFVARFGTVPSPPNEIS